MLDKNLYAKLCSEDNDLSLFHKNWWLDIVCTSWDVAIVKRGDDIAGVWPFNIEKKLGITISRSPMLTPYLGPHIFFPTAVRENKRDNFEHEIVSALLQQLPYMKVWHTACRPGLKQVGLFKGQHFQTTVAQTFIMDLQATEDIIWERLHEESKRNIRKAATKITIANEPDAIRSLYDFHVATLRRQDFTARHSFETLQQLFAACQEHNAAALWVARKDNEVQAILWNVWDGTRAYNLVAARNPQVKDNHAMAALIWQAIKHSKYLGKTSFDFEGSMIPGVERFFRNFGGKRELYPILLRNDSIIWRIIKTIRP